MEDLEPLVRDASFEEVERQATAWDAKRKKAVAKWTTAFWKNRGDRLGQAHEQGDVRMRLAILHAAVANDAKAALLVNPPYRHYGIAWDQYAVPMVIDGAAKIALLNAVAHRGRDFAAEYVRELAEAKRKRPMYIEVPVALVAAFGLPLPQDPFLARAWAVQLAGLVPSDEAAASQAYQRTVFTVRAQAGAGGLPVFEGGDIAAGTPAEAVARLPGLAFMPQAVLALADCASDFGSRYQSAFLMDGVREVFRTLVAQGHVDRAALTAAAVGALARTDAVAAQRMQARLLVAADPQPEHLLPHADALASLLATASIGPAEAAQGLLERLDAAHPLAGGVFVSICQMVFARKEKGLRQAQLAWASRRTRDLAAQGAFSVRGMAEALACDELAIQNDAVARLLPAWNDLTSAARAEALPALEGAAARMDERLRARLMAHLGGTAKPAPALAPASPAEPRAAAAPPARAPWPGRAPFEPLRNLEADPTQMTDALSNTGYASTLEAVEQLQDLGIRAARVAGSRLPELLARRLGDYAPAAWTNPIPTLAKERALEIRRALVERTPYPLLSRPSFRDGTIAADDLLRRLAASVLPAGPHDLLFALLRVDSVGPHHVQALRGIGTRDATVAADFLAAGGAGQMKTAWEITAPAKERHFRDRRGAAWTAMDGPEVCVTLSALQTAPAIDGIPLEWARGFDAGNAPDIYEFDLRSDLVTGVLPGNAELLTAFHLWGFRKAGLESYTEGGKACCLALPLFTGAGGPAGPALHLAVFYAMSANAPEARIAGSDGLLALLAQGRFDAALAADLLAACVECGGVKATRLAASLERVAAAGEEHAVWHLLVAAIGAALGAATPPPGTPELLALASQVAPAVPARAPIAPLAGVASRKGGSKLLLEARRLHEVLSA